MRKKKRKEEEGEREASDENTHSLSFSSDSLPILG
jgi:hypothetical protein